VLAVVTDSIACLPLELVERYHIRVVPVRIVRGERVYRDGIDVTPEEAFAWLEAGEVLTTAQPAVGEFLDTYEELSRIATGIVSIHVSSGDWCGTGCGGGSSTDRADSDPRRR